MKYFKKRTLALILASTVTVLGTFAAQGYGNSLMALNVRSIDNAVGIDLLTKHKYDTGIDIIRKDGYTYNIILADTNSELVADYSLNKDIASFEVLTMPYTSSMKGYTKIIVKLNSSMPLKVSTGLYIESKNRSSNEVATTQKERSYSNTIHSRSGVDQIGTVDIKDSVKQFTTDESTKLKVVDFDNNNDNGIQKDILYIFLGLFLVLFTSVLLMLKAKEKIKDLTGESSVIDTNDETTEEQDLYNSKAKSSKIKRTISNLDKRYTHDVMQPKPFTQEEANEEEMQPNIVDLDELLQEKQFNNVDTTNNNLSKEDDNTVVELNAEESTLPNDEVMNNQEEQNWNLDDFLNMCELDETENEQQETTENEIKFDEDFYEKCITNDNLSFTKDDIEKIQALLDIEIGDDTKQYAVEHMTSPIKKIKKTTKEILENFMTTYVAKQNITFTNEDAQALYKIISVEIDSDFITDLKTNPSRMKEMQEEIVKQKAKPHNTSEILTLNVKDMLPDLSEALKKQGNKKIESNAKPQVVYYSKGYDVDTLSVTDLPNLAVEIDKHKEYNYAKPEELKLVDNSYQVGTLHIASELPDLEDVMRNPEKYQQDDQVVEEVDEKQLLNNIQNVSFKPFDDGSRDFEIINDIPEEDDISLTVSDVQNEFKQFGNNLEIIKEESSNDTMEINDDDDFVSLFDDSYVDLDKQEKAVVQEQPEEKQSKAGDIAKELIDRINQQSKRKFNRRTINRVIHHQKELKEQESVSKPEFCIIDDEQYSIVNVTKFNDIQGCYLAKNDSGYFIIGFDNNKTFKIKQYENLSSERLQSRVNAKLEDGMIQYLIRVGKNKFIMNISENKMEFVMDLC